jgi:hypothetical protein
MEEVRMRSVVRIAGSFLAALSLVLVSVTPGDAASCGDANRTGTVTVTDGVLVLRAAAQLPAICPRERCDMNVDGGVSVTDGVLALRVAAGIQTQVACSASQADVIFGQIVKNTGAGRVASPAARARAAGTTQPCAGGGSIEDSGTVLTFVECSDGDFITDGTLEFSSDGSGTVSVAYSTTDFVISTGEVTETSGILSYVFSDTENTRVDGVLDHSSSVIGAYTEEYSDVRLDQDFSVLSGTVNTTVTDGFDFFSNVTTIDTFIYSPTLARIYVAYVDAEPDVFTLADGLCEPCAGGCSNGSLACVSCVDQCSNDSDRCGVDFDLTGCDDGNFGPAGLCDPCTSNDQCNASNGLSCFACDSNCTGSTDRCGSSFAFVECIDGFY